MATFQINFPVPNTVFDLTSLSIQSFSANLIVAQNGSGMYVLFDGTFSGIVGGIPQGTMTEIIFSADNLGTQVFEDIADLNASNNNVASIFGAVDQAAILAYLTSQNDLALGSGGNDTIDLGAGNDGIFGTLGTDTLIGGSGNDSYYVALAGATIVENLAGGSDTVYSALAAFTLPDNVENLVAGDVPNYVSPATSFNLTGNGLANNIGDKSGAYDSTLSGLGGDDLMYGLGGNDTLDGGDGIDTLYGDGDFGDNGNDTIYGGAGSDTLEGGGGNDTLVGNADVFAQESDTLNGGSGHDTILGEFTDIIDGGDGVDTLYAVNSFDWSIDLGATSIEWMVAGFGNDTIDADAQLFGVTVFAGGGNDTLIGGVSGDYLWAESGNDTVNGGDGADVIVGDLGADSLSGGGGNDQIYCDGQDILLDGGADTDALYITNARGLPAAFNLNLAATHFEWVGDYAGGSDTLDASGNTAATTIYAGNGADIVTGGTGADFLWGEAGNDTVNGGGASDTLVGGIGADNLTGGRGVDNIFLSSGGGGDGSVDTVFYTATNWGTDFIYDFVHGTDKINMQGTGAAAGTITISNVGGHAQVHFGSDLFVVVGAGATLTTADFIF